jgi:chromosome segregation ATPase
MSGLSVGPHVEPASLAITTPAMARELSGGHSHLKRLGNVRRNSPASAGLDQTPSLPSRAVDGNDSDDLQGAEQTVRQLTETLEGLRQENEQVERQIGEEDAEYEASRANFMKERDHLKHALKEREEASSELRKQVAQLDRANRAAQSKKAAKEKVLHQKEGERRKMKHDILRWDREIVDVGRELQEMGEEKTEIAEAKDQKTIDIRRDIRECQDSMKLMEEEIRIKGVHIKELEEERKKIGGVEDAEENRVSERIEKDHDLQWDMKLRGLQARYTTLWNALQQVCPTHAYSFPNPLLTYRVLGRDQSP